MLAQIPLTFGNSVVAPTDAEREYFGQRARRVDPRRLASSISIANVAAGLTGGLPVCHGAGGVTAHYRLGARTAGATLMVGTIYVTLGVALGASLPAFLHLLAPRRSPGCSCSWRSSTRCSPVGWRGWTIALHRRNRLITLVTGNLAIGAGAGIVALVLRALLRRRIGSPSGPAPQWKDSPDPKPRGA